MIIALVGFALFLLWIRLPRETRSSVFWLLVLLVLVGWWIGVAIETFSS